MGLNAEWLIHSHAPMSGHSQCHHSLRTNLEREHDHGIKSLFHFTASECFALE